MKMLKSLILLLLILGLQARVNAVGRGVNIFSQNAELADANAELRAENDAYEEAYTNLRSDYLTQVSNTTELAARLATTRYANTRFSINTAILAARNKRLHSQNKEIANIVIAGIAGITTTVVAIFLKQILIDQA